MLKGLLLVLVVACPLSTTAQTEPEFPTEVEINTVMTQVNFAMKQFEQTMHLETTNLGKDAETKKTEKHTLENWNYIASVMSAKPDNFNSGAGFMVVDLINSAYQSVLLCEITAQTNLGAANVLKNENVQSAAREVSQRCLSTAELLVIVKLSATDLYTKYLKAQKIAYEKAFTTAIDCSEALKRSRTKKP